MRGFRKKIQLPGLVYLVTLSIVPSIAFSDIYVWGELVGLASNPTTCAASADAVDVTFTMVNPTGEILQNTDAAANSTAGYQTQTCGTLTYDTETKSGSAEIVAFNFFGAGPAEAKAVGIDLIPSPQDLGTGNLFLGNMLFDWSGNNGIPVSLVWDAQGILGEMDGASSSFTLSDNSGGANNSGSSTISIIQTASSPFSGVGGTPATDGNDAFIFSGMLLVELVLGPQPMAATRYNTTNVTACLVPDPGPDGIFNTADDIKDCMMQNPSADISSSIVVDSLNNPTATAIGTLNPPTTDGMGGNPMQDGPFTGFNANFDWNNFKLIGFTDTSAPTISLNAHVTPAGTSPLTLSEGVDTYTEPGASCTDAAPLNSNLNADVVIGGDTVNTNIAATYTVTYNCSDPSGNAALQVTRTVVVLGAGPPVVSLLGDNPATQECAIPYVDAGAVCDDAEDGVIPEGSNFVRDQSAVDAGINTVASYDVSWTCQDITNPNPPVTEIRTVNVVDTIAPVITLLGDNPETVLGSTTANPQIYVDAGASATDTCDSVGFPITNFIATSGVVSMNVADTQTVVPYTLTYTAIDDEGNSGSVVRSVEVSRAQPVITLLGDTNLILNVGATYTEQGMDVEDLQDGNLTAITTTGTTVGTGAGADNLTHTVSGTVDTSTQGTYTITYEVVDSAGNPATTLTRTVVVGVFAEGSNFTMLDAQGNVFGGTNDVIFDWDQTLNLSETDTNFNMSISSAGPFPFFGFVWTAHHTRVFGPGTYSFDSGCTNAEIEATGCPAGSAANTGPAISMTVPAGYVGSHILFDWNTSTNIDVVNVWEIDGVWDQHGDTDPKNQLYNGLAGDPPDPTTSWKLVSTDVNGDGVNGSPMVDGPFQGFYANFNAGPGASAPPPEPYTATAPDTKLSAGLSINIWALFAGLLTLLGLRRLGSL